MFFALVLALLSDPTWPAPCRDAGTCWLAWDATDRATSYEVVSADLLCGKVLGWTGAKGRPQPPDTTYQPRPGDGCWQPGAQLEYAVLACNDAGCSPSRSNAVSFGPQDWACYSGKCEVPCYEGAPLRYPQRGGCP